MIGHFDSKLYLPDPRDTVLVMELDTMSNGTEKKAHTPGGSHAWRWQTNNKK